MFIESFLLFLVALIKNHVLGLSFMLFSADIRLNLCGFMIFEFILLSLKRSNKLNVKINTLLFVSDESENGVKAYQTVLSLKTIKLFN